MLLEHLAIFRISLGRQLFVKGFVEKFVSYQLKQQLNKVIPGIFPLSVLNLAHHLTLKSQTWQSQIR